MLSGVAIRILALAAVQPESTEAPDLRCGAYCLFVSLDALGVQGLTFEQVERKLGPPSPRGYSLGQLDEVAKSYGLHALGVKTTTSNLRRRDPPFACIALVKGTHFVNIGGADDREAFIVDPPKDYTVPLDTLGTMWDGTALLISTSPLVPEEELGRTRRILWYVGVFAVAALVAGVVIRGVYRRKS